MLMTNKWRTGKLGELVTFKTGKLDSNAAVPNGDYPFFTCSQETLRTNTFAFDTECVLLAGNNANGIYPLKYFHGKFDAYQRTYVVRPQNAAILNTQFLYYTLRPKLSELRSFSTGAATKFLTMTILNETEIGVPPLPTQQKIAGILSAYDELIENSQRRIRILESMARALYREWFVHFRFPGHEKHPRIASPLGDIPKGWEVLEFRHLFDIRYGKTLPKTKISDSGTYPVYGAGDIIGFYDKMLCPNKCALVTSRGNGSGTVWRTREAAFVTNNSLIMLPQEQRSHWDYSFVELLLKHANVMEAKTGSAQPQVTIENLNYVKAIAPTKLLVIKFCEISTPIYEQVDMLFRQIQNLRQTRDLLLPRLLSGQVELNTN
jgi:type I restriction enzyme S subunit